MLVRKEHDGTILSARSLWEGRSGSNVMVAYGGSSEKRNGILSEAMGKRVTEFSCIIPDLHMQRRRKVLKS